MSYSDEPNVISSRQKPRGLWIAGGIVAVLIVSLAIVALYPHYQEFKRKNTPVGPNQGPVYFISIDDERYSMELARPEEMDFHMGFFLQPVRDRVVWEPEAHMVRFRVEGADEFIELPWNPNAGYFGPTEDRFHPAVDYPLEIEIWREDEQVWSGTRFAYRPRAGHEH